MMPSSVKVGLRPSMFCSRSNSSGVRPCSATSAGVTAGSPGRGATSDTSDRDLGENGFEQSDTVARAKQRTARALGMRHQSKHTSVVIDDSGDVALGAVGIGLFRDVASRIDVAENDATFPLQPIESFLSRNEPSVAMRDGDAQYFTALIEIGEHCPGVLDANANRIRHELQVGVAEQSARQESGFTGDLKSVANAQHRPA